MKTLIVGNGILALCTAFRLSRQAAPGDEIVLVGPRARPGSATLAAGAMLNVYAEMTPGAWETEAG
ncbi:MAG: hypothetical protein LBL69_01970, partial [Zoogloeaceae bacterium]|nr:hypothetical protein [Zoogloeaceae bacterium]